MNFDYDNILPPEGAVAPAEFTAEELQAIAQSSPEMQAQVAELLSQNLPFDQLLAGVRGVLAAEQEQEQGVAITAPEPLAALEAAPVEAITGVSAERMDYMDMGDTMAAIANQPNGFVPSPVPDVRAPNRDLGIG